MYILNESEVNQDIAKLDRAWSDHLTFAFLPSRRGVSEDWVKRALSQFPQEFQENHFALLTSGSTGLPKLILASKKRAEKLVAVLHKIQHSEPVRKTVLALPLTYCYAFVNQWLWSRTYNRELIFSGGFRNPDSLRNSLLQVEDGMLCLVGAQVQLFTNHYGDDISFPGIIRLHFAGGPFPQNEISIVKKLFPNARIFNNYGCAEAMPRLSIRPLEDSDEGSNIGRALPGIEMKTGEQGEILFRSIYRAVGFYDHNGLYIPREKDWIPSGDLGERIENGYWRLKGRNNEVFKRFGEKISLPQLLETVYVYWSGQAAFYREKDASGEEGHVLILAPTPTENQVRDILQCFRKTHPRTHWPIRVESTTILPTLPNGKIDKLGLAEIPHKSLHWRQRG